MITKEKASKEFTKKKKEYIKANLNNDNVYDYLTPQQQEVIKKYYEHYTVMLFNRLRGSLRLEVSELKAKSLADLKGDGDWNFAGMVDMRVKGAEFCELGHPLRYCYYAINVKNGSILRFGSTCVGDFFDLSPEDVKVLTNIKDIMLKEIKEMVAIKENNWFDAYTLLDADVIGLIWKYMGSDSLPRLDIKNFKNIMLEFIAVGLPIPSTLLSEILQDRVEIEGSIDEFLMFEDSELLKDVYNCGIPFISEIYKIGLGSIVDTVKSNNTLDITPNIKQIYKYFGFDTKDNLIKNLNIWLNRADKVKKSINYFKKIGVESSWSELFSEAQKDTEVDKEIYQGLNLLSVFDIEGEVTRAYIDKSTFSYKFNGVELQLEVITNFDMLLDKLARKSTIEYILGVEEKLITEKKLEKAQKDKETQIIDYITENIEKVKYKGIWGKDAIKDIIINKGLTFERMTDKQSNFVKRYYTEMQGIDLRDVKESQNIDENRTYLLKDKPEVITKIQRLQNEVEDVLPQKTKDIMSSIIKYKKVSDRQLRYINDAYLEYVLGEKPVIVKPNTIEPIKENNKYKLQDRPDIKEKLERIQNSSKYNTLPEKTRDIINSILKYNSVSDKQLSYIESALERTR